MVRGWLVVTQVEVIAAVGPLGCSVWFIVVLGKRGTGGNAFCRGTTGLGGLVVQHGVD